VVDAYEDWNRAFGRTTRDNHWRLPFGLEYPTAGMSRLRVELVEELKAWANMYRENLEDGHTAKREHLREIAFALQDEVTSLHTISRAMCAPGTSGAPVDVEFRRTDQGRLPEDLDFHIEKTSRAPVCDRYVREIERCPECERPGPFEIRDGVVHCEF